ncbi:VanZ family protein [Microbacterium gorillae]|uniref:VanZ family protein n=1 Tax=Microbacterium gorillae TaxID=1231063 RepID=UPI0018A8394E|nr:VanZ family protein [Microbacterium gorillae]
MTDEMTRLLRGGRAPAVRRPPKSHLRAWVAGVGLLAYLGVVLAATLSPTPLDKGYGGAIDKVLSVGYRNGLPAWFGYAELEFLANVAMFIPLGFLLGLVLPRRGIWVGILLLPAFSAGVEACQAMFLAARFATIGDVIANSIGGWVGLLAAVIIRALVYARDQKVIARALHDARFGPPR